MQVVIYLLKKYSNSAVTIPLFYDPKNTNNLRYAPPLPTREKPEKKREIHVSSDEISYEQFSSQRTRAWINSNKFYDFPVETDDASNQQKNNSNVPFKGEFQNKSNIFVDTSYTELIPRPVTTYPEKTKDEKSKLSTQKSSCSATIVSESVLTIDDERDRDFEPEGNISETSSLCLSNKSKITLPVEDNIIKASPKIQLITRRNEKNVQCKYCECDVVSKNYVRHLERHHKEEDEVHKILECPKNSKERRLALGLLRNNTNFDLFLTGKIRPIRELKKENDAYEYIPCASCKGLYMKNYLKRHAKSCAVRKEAQLLTGKIKQGHHLSCSQTIIACAMDATNVISKLNIKEQVFDVMKPDHISLVAKKDLLIAHIGESYLKKHKRERMIYAASNKMRELSRLLIAYRTLINDENLNFTGIIHPKNFDRVVIAVREISGYNHENKKFNAPSLAMHMGTSLKLACDELVHLILRQNRGFKTKSSDDQKEWIQNVKFFKELLESRWNTELASLANKDMAEKRWEKPLLLPLVSDIKKFREEVLKIANECEQHLANSDENESAYKLLVQSTLALLIVFNRRRIGDVQYLKIKDYLNDKRTNIKDFENALTPAEIVLTKKYKRVVNSGKGSRAVIILVPDILQNFVNLLLKHRSKYIPTDNEYVFAIPRSTIKWGKGDIAIKSLCKKIKLEQPDTISSNKLRKQIATIMQILNLSKDESKQFANFMGHTQKTHDEFYELPVDIYQTAKVSKLLVMMEKGTLPIEYQGKSLAEIDIDPNSEFADEDHYEGEGVVFLASADDNHVNGAENCVNETIEYNDLGKDIKEKNNGRNKNLDGSIMDANANSGENEHLTSNEEIVNKTDDEPYKSEDLSSDNSDVPIKNKKAKKSNSSKQGWTNEEISLIQKQFKSYIGGGTYPAGKAMNEFLTKNNLKKTVPVLRSKIQHLIRLNSK